MQKTYKQILTEIAPVLKSIVNIRTEVEAMEQGYQDEPRLQYLKAQLSVALDKITDASFMARLNKERYEKQYKIFKAKEVTKLQNRAQNPIKAVNRAELEVMAMPEYEGVIKDQAEHIALSTFLSNKIDSVEKLGFAIGSGIASINADKKFLS